MSDIFILVLLRVIQLFLFAIFGQVILSWLLVAGIRNDVVVRLYQVLTMITDPVMRPLRRIVPNVGTIDITPMIAIILLVILQEIVRSLL